MCTRIIKEIETGGPMPFDRYMAMALYEPGLGYYVNGLQKFGTAGDFVTAPEQGPLFAQALARQLDEVATKLDSEWVLLEPGAGSGALARDLLEGLTHPPARYLILEPSAALREVQAETLADLPESLRRRIKWIDQPPEQPFDGVILANEVLDALPAKRFVYESGEFRELCIQHADGRLAWTTTRSSPRLARALDALERNLSRPLPDGYQSELCVDLPAWLETISTPLARGMILLIDYGYPRQEYYHPDRSAGTLVCHYRHRAHFDPFVWPGLTDLSVFVDFTATAEAAHTCGLKVAGYTTQAGFLLSLGIAESVEHIDDPQQRLRHAAEIKRLTLPGEMGEKFKVIALVRDFDHPLSGFGMMSHLHRL